MKVTEDQILGKPGDGFTQLLGTTAYGKLGFTAVFVGTALGAADIALKYCQEKLHRGKSITKFPTTQLRLSTMLTYAHTAELLLLEAADYCDHNHFAGDDIPTMRAVQARTAQAKGYAAETATKVATMAVNAMGAYGVCDEYQAERFLRDAAVAPQHRGLRRHPVPDPRHVCRCQRKHQLILGFPLIVRNFRQPAPCGPVGVGK